MSEQKRSRGKRHARHTARYRARRRAADILFEAEARDLDPVVIVEDRIDLARDPNNGVAPVAEYTQQIVRGAAEELDALDDAIARYLSEDWELHRIPAVDRAIMRVATWELLFNPEVPPVTAVVEAVELASEYSTDQAAPYVNAVLDDIAQSLSVDNPMNIVASDDDEDSEDPSEEVSEDGSGNVSDKVSEDVSDDDAAATDNHETSPTDVSDTQRDIQPGT